MVRRPPRSTRSGSSAASDVYKGQVLELLERGLHAVQEAVQVGKEDRDLIAAAAGPYTHPRAHETVLELVCRPLLEKKKKKKNKRN